MPCASLRHPIISHDLIFATRNTKLAFHLRELQFAASARHLRRPVSLSVHSFPFIPSRVIRFLSAEQPFGYFPICPRRFLDHIGFITFSRLRPSTIFADGERIDVAFCPASNEICEGSRRVTMKGPVSASADHVIILSRCKAAGTQNENFRLPRVPHS